MSMGPIAARHARTVARARRADPGDRAARRGAGARRSGWRSCRGARRPGRRRRRGATHGSAARRPAARRRPRAGPGPRRGDALVQDGALADLAGASPAKDADLTRPMTRSGSSTSPTSAALRPDPAVRRSRASTTGPATTGRTPTAARRRPGSAGSKPRPAPRRALRRRAAEPVRRPGRRSRCSTRSPRPARPTGRRSTLSRTTTTSRPRTRSRRAPPPRPAVGADAPRKLGAPRPRPGGLRELRQGPPGRRRRRRLRPVRPAVGLPARPAPARALPAAARRAAAGGDHLHRDDRRGARRAATPGAWSRPSATTWPAAASRRSRRTLSVGARPDATSAATPEFWLDGRVRTRRRRRALPGRPARARLTAEDPARRRRPGVERWTVRPSAIATRPPMAMIQALGNVSKVRGALIFVEDIEAELSFYRDVIGLRLLYRTPAVRPLRRDPGHEPVADRGRLGLSGAEGLSARRRRPRADRRQPRPGAPPARRPRASGTRTSSAPTSAGSASSGTRRATRSSSTSRHSSDPTSTRSGSRASADRHAGSAAPGRGRRSRGRPGAGRVRRSWVIRLLPGHGGRTGVSGDRLRAGRVGCHRRRVHGPRDGR